MFCSHWMPPRPLKLPRNFHIDGNATKCANIAPDTNSSVENRTNGTTRRFSLEYSPGATNSHTCVKMNGDAMINPDSRHTYMLNMKAPIGRTYVSWPPCDWKYRARYTNIFSQKKNVNTHAATSA